MAMIEVNLSCVDVFGVVVTAPTGVLYSSQTAGMACNHPVQQGFWVPVAIEGCREFEDLIHDRICSIGGFTSDQMDFLDEALARFGLPLICDRKNAPAGEEAWIPVVITRAGRYSPFEKLEGRQGILVTGNCD